MKKKQGELVIFQDSEKIIEMKARLENLKNQAQMVLDRFNDLNLPGTENIDFQTIINGSEALIQQYLRSKLPDNLDIEGLKINKEKALSLGLIEMTGRNEFVNALTELIANPDSGLINYLELFAGEIIINPNRLSAFIAQNSVIADTPDKVEVFNKWKALCDALNSFNDIMDGQYGIRVHRRGNFPQSFAGWFICREEQLQVNFRFFQKLFRPQGTRMAKPETAEV